MSNNLLNSPRLFTYVSSIVDRKIRPLSLSLSTSLGLLRSLVTSSKTSADASDASAYASNLSAISSQAALDYFKSHFIGVYPSDPTVASYGHAIANNAIYVRSTDGRLRWVTSVDINGNLTWGDANVVAFPTMPGTLTIQGTGNNAALILDNQNTAIDYRIVAKDDGHLAIVDNSNGTELLIIVAGILKTGVGAVFWNADNDGSGSGLDADLLDGLDSTAFAKWAGGTFTNTITVQGDVYTYKSGGTTGAVYLNSAGTRYLYNDGTSYFLPSQQLYVNGALVWNSANDGSGSGMDTDLFRGQTDAIFIKKSEILYGSNTNGYWRSEPVSGGKFLLVQYGSGSAGEPTSGPFTFPKTFNVGSIAEIDFQVTSTGGNASATSGDDVGGNVNTTSTYTLFSDDGTKGVRWRAEAIVNSVP
jgi:hypothetical protein